MICAVVLAAGRSERMGTQKLLLPLGGKPLIARVVDEISHSHVEHVFVVIGRAGERLRAALTDKSVHLVENPDDASDMLGSVRCGLRALPTDCEAVLAVLGDQPGITRRLVDELIRRFRASESRIIVPTCNGHRGHPVLFSARYFEELLNGYNGDGLRGFLDAHTAEVSSVALPNSDGLEDMDTPADYQRQKEMFSDS